MRIKTLEEIHEKDIKYFGRKAFYLGSLIREGLQVPSGVALFHTAEIINSSNINLLIQKLEVLGLNKKKLAVRSSAPDEDDFLLSHAGKYESYLNLEDPVIAINNCFKLSRSVIIQEMIDSNYGGVCFSNGISQPENIIIEMCIGANSGATQGKGVIARVEIEKDLLNIKSTHDPDLIITKKMMPKLLELAQSTKNIERSFGFGVDIEWCVAQETIYFLQARPITALSTSQVIENIKHGALESLLSEHSSLAGLWTDTSVGDMFRNASVLFMDVLNADLGSEWAVRKVFLDLGLRPEDKLKGPLFRSICARAYICLANYLNFLLPDLCLKPYVKRKVDGFLDVAFTVGAINLKNLRASLRHFFRLLFVVPFCFLRARKNFSKAFSSKELQKLKDHACNWEYQKDDTASLYQEFTRIRLMLGKEVIYAHLMSDIIAGISQVICTFYLKLLFGKDAPRWEYELTTGLLGNLNTEMSLELYDLANEKINIDDFMKKFGHRGSPDWDFGAPRFRENPEKIHKMAAFVTQSGENLRERFINQIAIREEAEKKLKEYLQTSFWRVCFKKIICKEISYLQYFSPIREQTQSVVYHWIELLRKVLFELGARLGFGEDIFYLKDEELKIICDSTQVNKDKSLFLKRARERKYEQELSRRIYVPHIFEQKDLNLNLFYDDSVYNESSFIMGIKASQGKVQGRARVMHDLDEAININPDDVIIARFADPSFTPILLSAAGLVLEQGSVYSHCAIVAREFGLPVIVNAQGATSRIKSGQSITLDADNGRIWLEAY